MKKVLLDHTVKTIPPKVFCSLITGIWGTLVQALSGGSGKVLVNLINQSLFYVQRPFIAFLVFIDFTVFVTLL